MSQQVYELTWETDIDPLMSSSRAICYPSSMPDDDVTAELERLRAENAQLKRSQPGGVAQGQREGRRVGLRPRPLPGDPLAGAGDRRPCLGSHSRTDHEGDSAGDALCARQGREPRRLPGPRQWADGSPLPVRVVRPCRRPLGGSGVLAVPEAARLVRATDSL